MQEGALRFGINAVHHFLGGENPAEAEGSDAARLFPKSASVWEGDAKALSVWQDFAGVTAETLTWRPEAWGNGAEMSLADDGNGGRALRIGMKAGTKDKVALKYDIPATDDRRLNLVGTKSLVLDVRNGHSGGFGLSLVLTTVGPDNHWRDFETKAIYLKPGWNRNVRFVLENAKFKSRETGWKNYDADLTNPSACGKVGLFLYNQGRIQAPVLISSIRFEK